MCRSSWLGDFGRGIAVLAQWMHCKYNMFGGHNSFTSMPQATANTTLTQRLYRSRNPQSRSFYIYITFIWPAMASFRFVFVERRALPFGCDSKGMPNATTKTLTQRLYRSRNPQSRSFYIYITFIWPATASFRFVFVERRALPFGCDSRGSHSMPNATTKTLTERLGIPLKKSLSRELLHIPIYL
jgi:hypothetical protein